MKEILFKAYFALLRLRLKLTKTTNSWVILNGAGRSGSNGYLFYKWLKQHHPEVEVTLVEPWPSSHLSWSTFKKIGQAKFIVTTHEPFKVKKGQVSISLWHGIPLKRMGFAANNTSFKADLHELKVWQKNADVVVTSSDLYSSLMTACVGLENSKYITTGFPRIDALANSTFSKQQLLNDLFNLDDKDTKIGIYMPTFRWELENEQVIKQVQAGNFMALTDFDLEQLNSALARNNQCLLVKLHPYEMKLVNDLHFKADRIAFLNDRYLRENQLDLYELLPATDFLMTDFSSIYFDYLHLNKPIIFVANYLSEYQQKRGLLLSPYEDVTPGAKVTTQAQLHAALDNLVDDNFASQRQTWLKMTYQVASEGNSQRLYEWITNLGENN